MKSISENRAKKKIYSWLLSFDPSFWFFYSLQWRLTERDYIWANNLSCHTQALHLSHTSMSYIAYEQRWLTLVNKLGWQKTSNGKIAIPAMLQNVLEFGDCRHFSFSDHFWNNLLQPFDPSSPALNSIPDSHEGESEKESKGSSKLCQQGGERVEKNFLLDLCSLGGGHEGNGHVVLGQCLQFDISFVHAPKFILLVTARNVATWQRHNLWGFHGKSVKVQLLEIPAEFRNKQRCFISLKLFLNIFSFTWIVVRSCRTLCLAHLLCPMVTYSPPGKKETTVLKVFSTEKVCITLKRCINDTI